MRTPNEVNEVIQDLQRWRDVRSRLTERNLQRKQTGKRTVLQNDSLTIAIALLLEYRQLLVSQDVQEVEPTDKWPGGGGPVVVEPMTGLTIWAEDNPFEMREPVVTFAPNPAPARPKSYTVVAKGHHHVFSDEDHAFRTYLDWIKLPKVDNAVADLMAELHARFAERAKVIPHSEG